MRFACGRRKCWPTRTRTRWTEAHNYQVGRSVTALAQLGRISLILVLSFDRVFSEKIRGRRNFAAVYVLWKRLRKTGTLKKSQIRRPPLSAADASSNFPERFSTSGTQAERLLENQAPKGRVPACSSLNHCGAKPPKAARLETAGRIGKGSGAEAGNEKASGGECRARSAAGAETGNKRERRIHICHRATQ